MLDHLFPGAPWLHQAQDGIELLVHRCIEQFGNSPSPTNGEPIREGTDYRERARTASEIKATMAAEEAAVSAARHVPRYREDPYEIEIPESELADPLQPAKQPPAAKSQPPAAKNGWLM